MPKVDDLYIEIQSDASDAEKSLDGLVKSLDNMKSSIRGLNAGNLSSFSTAMSKLNRTKFDNKGLQNFTNSLGRMSKNNPASGIKDLVDGFKELSGLNFDNKNLQSFVNSVGRLGKANVGNVDFAQLSSGMSSFINTMAQANNVDKSTIQITNAVASLAKQGGNIGFVSSGLPSLSNALLDFSNKMSGAKTVSANTIDFTKALGSLASAGKRTAETTGGLSALARELMNVFNTLSKAPKLRGDIVRMAGALGDLAKAGSRTSSATRSLSKGLNMFSASAGNATKKSFSLASAIGKLYATYWLLFRAFGKLGDSINIASDLTEVQNVVDVTFGKYKSMVEDMAATSITDFGMSELTVKQISSRFQAMGTAMGFTQGKMSDMSIELTKLAADMASFYNVEQDLVAEDLESIFTGQTRNLRKFGLDLTEATLREWAMKQGMDANIEAMGQMEKTMLRYQYVMANTGAAQGDFLRTQDSFANRVRILKQSLEQLSIVLGRTFINALKPLVKYLNVAVQAITQFAQMVSDALGKIFGWKYEVGSGGITADIDDAADGAGDLAGGIGDAVKAAQKLRQQLHGIDELNVLTTDTAGKAGGGGSGTGAGTGAVSGGSWTQDADSMFKAYESEIDTLYKLGEKIGETLSNALKNIDWNKIYENAKNFGKGLAEFLNGLISTDLFADIGTTIAGSLNTALYALNSFGKTFDWTGFGESLAEGINNFFREFDFRNLAETISVWIRGALQSVTSLLKNTDFEVVGKKIGEFIADLDLVGISADLARALWEAIKAAASALVGLFQEAPIEAAFISAFGLIKFGGLTTSLGVGIGNAIAGSATATAVTGAISTVATTIGSALIAAIGGFWVGKSLGAILFPDDEEFYTNFSWSDFFDKLNPEDAKGAWEEFWKEITGGQHETGGESFGGGSGRHEITISAKPDLESAKASAKEINEALKTAGAGSVIAYTKAEDKSKTSATKSTLISNLGSVTTTATINKLNVDKVARTVNDLKGNIIKTTLSKSAKKLNNVTANVTKTSYTKLSDKQKTLSLKGTIDSNRSKQDLQNELNKTPIELTARINPEPTIKKKPPGMPTSDWEKYKQNFPWFTGWQAKGGIFANGRWKPIQMYAGGGYPSHGTIFGAGEAGPEVVGHINGRTEVLNESQLANVMYASVQQANSETNALLRQQNTILIDILQKETGINYKEVFKATQRGANEYTNRTGRPAFA